MAAETIDMGKITKSFDHLAETKEGQATLATFRQAIEDLRGGIPANLKLNNHEFLTVLQKLVNRMDANKLTPAKGAELSDEQLSNVSGGVLTSSYFDTSITRLGDYRLIGNTSFNIMIVA